MNDIEVNNLLSQLRTLSQAAKSQGVGAPAAAAEEGAQTTDFAALLKNSIEQVNTHQQTARSLAAAFETGEGNVDLAQVMVALQKASVSFQAMLQVRNKLVSAYQDVMNISM